MSLTLKAIWEKKWRIPGTPWTVCGYSRAADKTAFYIKELDIMLDAGPQNYNKPAHIFITHTHGDHIASLPLTMITDTVIAPFEIYAPLQAETHIRRYISALFEVNALLDMPISIEENNKYFHYNGFDKPTKFRMSLNKTDVEISVILCDHSLPTISYCFSVVRNKLKEEYLGLAGKEIAKLRKDGVEITSEVINPMLAYVCDTSIAVFSMHPELLSYPVLFIECTFLYPNERDNAVETKHVHWEELCPIVIANPQVLFVLFHFSLRYKEEEIVEFFAAEQARIGIHNIKVWAGEEGVYCQKCMECITSS